MNDIFDVGKERFVLSQDITAQIERAGLGALIKWCHFLYAQAFYANTQFGILKALQRAPSQFEHDVTCARCFFNTAHMCLAESIAMSCARLYDGDSDVSLGKLLALMDAQSSLIDKRVRELACVRPSFDPGKPICHTLAADEERFYHEEVDVRRHWEDLVVGMVGSASEDVPGSANGQMRRAPVTVSMTVEELCKLWTKRLSGLKKLNANLREQRNKILAHNDLEALSYEAFAAKYPLRYDDIRKLLDLALDVTVELNRIVSGTIWPRKAGNTNDVEGLLRYVDLGMKAFQQGLR